MPNIRPKDIPTTASFPAPDDWEILDGAVNGTRKLAASYRDTQIAARALADRLVSDAATSGRGIIYTGGARQALAGLPTVQIAFDLRAPSSAAISAVWSSSSSSSLTFVANSLGLVTPSGNELVIRALGTTTSDSRAFTHPTFWPTYSGQRIRGLITFTTGTTNPVVYINGTDVSASFTASTAGTPPSWLDASLSSAFQIVGFNWPFADIPFVVPILGSLSTAERDTWFSTGVLPPWVWAGGSAVSVTAGSFVVRTEYVITSVGTTDFTLIGAAANTVGLRFTATGAGTGTGTAVRAGALTIPGPQGIGTVRDLTAIAGNQGRLVGVTPILATSQPVSVVERPAESYTAATSVQLLGGAITGGRKRRLVSVSGNSSASVNLSLGTSSGGTQLVNAQAVNGDFDISTFASRILAANTSLWLTFSGNTTASIVIQITDL